MPYASPTDLSKLLNAGELLSLAADDPTAGLDNPTVQAVLAEMIDQADREIDSYVGLVRSVPVSPVPGLLQNFSQQMAVYHLFKRRGEVPEDWRNQYAACRKTLEKIAERRLHLGDEDSEPQNAPGTVRVHRAEPKLFGNLGRNF